MRLKFLDPLATRLIPRLIGFWIRLLGHTLKFEWYGFEKLAAHKAQNKPAIYAFWHGRLSLMPYGYNIVRAAQKNVVPRFIGAGFNNRIYMLISQHRDGEFISRVMGRFGIETVRGSSSRGGVRALRELVHCLRQGADVAITPDGPKGPYHEVQPGVIFLAKLTGAPIFPVSLSTSHKKFLASWDKFLLPYPWGRAAFFCGEPIYVPADADDREIARIREMLQQELNRLTLEADRYFDR